MSGKAPIGLDSYTYAQENFIQWGIPFSFIFRSRFALFFFSFILNHYVMTYRHLAGSHCILDVGCGLGLPMRCLRHLGLRSKAIALDVSAKYLRRVVKLGIYNDYVLASAKYIPFKEKSFKSLMCLQVLEHLTKMDGVTALKELSQVADLVIVTTPVGFVEADANPINPFQKHKSGWYPEDLIYFGYKVRGYGWLRIKRFYRIIPILIILNFFFALIIQHVPRFAYYMYAIKTK